MAAEQGSSRSRVTRIQRRHFRNSSSPVAHEVSGLCSSDEKRSTNKRLPTPPLTPRPPATATPVPSTIRRASNPIRKQSPSPRSSHVHVSNDSESGNYSSVASTRVPSLTEEDVDHATIMEASASHSVTSGSNERRALDPVQLYRQGVMPYELRELLQSRGANLEGELQLISSRPAPLPPIASPGPTTAVDSTRLRGHAQYPPRQNRHFILAKAQGLSSAPSTVRVLRYSSKQPQDSREDSGSGLLEAECDKDDRVVSEVGAVEGTLLVKETVGRKDSALQELHQR